MKLIMIKISLLLLAAVNLCTCGRTEPANEDQVKSAKPMALSITALSPNPQSTNSTSIKPLLNKALTTYHSSQVMVVTARSATSSRARLTAFIYQNGTWKKVYTMPAAIGKNGITPHLQEGSKQSPSGIFTLGPAFGIGKKPDDVTIPYRQTTNQDYWVENPYSPDYNKWVTYEGDPKKRWKTFEPLRIPAYKYAVVINYNTNPIIKGKGSAIFLHVLLPEKSYTLGCTAVSESDMLTLLKWLNPSRHPLIIQGTISQLKALTNRANT
ncbi:L,D-transpeptidase family protein [Pullulanibacillus sp. KACC 23026]|uniref:L,D-transpeptidase family protein n=1 Tax=Pullulanibacillus sp. KACC 23026 TaxID=3028315 RepID=UPI0023AF1D91|nr:L,D-transpeptidase family protein [Pullulanibacillus sp. KACC 23026]WEG14819.1 L,D-transpeptidase family protein [Pullulanibacillus sp. KACC 23026]